MKISKQARRNARQLFVSCQVNGVLNEDRVRQAVDLVLGQKPRQYLQILSRLHRLVELEVERRTARVESAVPLSADLQAGVAERIKKIYGPGVNILFSRNPGLLGGLRIRIGSDLYDGSIRNRLDQLEQSFS